ncbi:MAG TPA: TerC family protein [Bdellovibrionales bacterium]|nr:TerC family protein [Bdellovibrionales bacterium]
MENWIGFAVLVVVALVLDLGVFQRKSHKMKLKEAALFSLFWVSLGLIFNVWVYYSRGGEPAMTFLTAYLVELSLSVDNLFVFLMLFSYFKVPEKLQHRVLFWGIIGAVVMRAIFIVAGIALINKFHWLLYVLGGFLVFVGIRMMFKSDEDVHPENNPMLILLRKVVPVTPDYREGKFIVHEEGKWWVTPLFVVLIAVETTDVIFAVDSIPAVLAISLDPYIVFTSNIFAILGLRSFFFLLSGIMPFFHYLHYGVSAILIFIGIKMLGSSYFHVPIAITLSLMATLIFGSVALSLLMPPKDAKSKAKK